MTTVYVLFEEKEIKGVFSNLDKALLHGEKLEDRGLVAHCRLDAFVHHPMSVDIHLLTPGEEPVFREGFNRDNIDMKDIHPKMREEIEALFETWEKEEGLNDC